MTLSVCLIAKNEELNVARCLDSIKQIADQIVIVIDSSTTDKTQIIAKKYSSSVFTRKFDSFAGQRNFGISKCTGDWILSIDCDEELSPQLIAEIAQLKNNDSNTYAVYGIKRLNIIFGQPIKHGNWDPNPINRLWKNGCASWEGDVHESLNIKSQPGKLNGLLIHYSYETVAQFISKMNKYTSLETHPAHPLKDFFRRYIWHAGFLDGWAGLILSYLMVIYHTVVWVKIWAKQK